MSKCQHGYLETKWCLQCTQAAHRATKRKLRELQKAVREYVKQRNAPANEGALFRDAAAEKPIWEAFDALAALAALANYKGRK